MDTTEVSSQKIKDAELWAMGYSRPLTLNSGEPIMTHEFAGSAMQLRWHKPCGQAIFDIDTHEEFCPAKK